MKSKSKTYKIWFYSEKKLEEISEKLLEKALVKSFEYDYENVYEWIEAQSDDLQIEFNFSRQHSYEREFEQNSIEQIKANLEKPITVLFMYDGDEPSDEIVEEFASSLSQILQCSVFLGNINYLGGDNYEYIKTKEISY